MQRTLFLQRALSCKKFLTSFIILVTHSNENFFYITKMKLGLFHM